MRFINDIGINNVISLQVPHKNQWKHFIITKIDIKKDKQIIIIKS